MIFSNHTLHIPFVFDFLSLFYWLYAEDIFYKTGNVMTGPAGPTGTSSKFNSASRWPLMTRAHLAQAMICAALLEKEETATVCIITADLLHTRA